MSVASYSPQHSFGNEWKAVSARLPGGGRDEVAYATLKEMNQHFLIGGLNDARLDSGSVASYNATMGVCAQHTPLSRPRRRCTAAAIDNNQLVVAGGWPFSAHKSSVLYDAATKKWSPLPSLNNGRYDHACVTTTSNNRVYVVGGSHTTGRNNRGLLDTIEELDLSYRRPRWLVLSRRLETKREGCRAVVDPRDENNIIVVGGRNEDGEFLTSCEVVPLGRGQRRGGDSQTPTTTTTTTTTTTANTATIPPLNTPRAYHTLVVVENRFLVAIGGHGGIHTLSSVEMLDLDSPGQLQWCPLPSMRSARSFFAAFVSSGGDKIIVAGGEDDSDNTLDTIEELQVHVQRPPPPPPTTAQQEPQAQQQQQDNTALSSLSDRSRRRQQLLLQQDQPRLLREPPPLNQLPPGHLDETHQSDVEAWIEESERHRKGFESEVLSHERVLEAQIARLTRQRDENRRIADAYGAHVRQKQTQARGLVGYIQSLQQDPQRPHPGRGITRTSGTDRPFIFSAQSRFDPSARSIRSIPDDMSEMTNESSFRNESQHFLVIE